MDDVPSPISNRLSPDYQPQPAIEAAPALMEGTIEASQPFVGRWIHLVSTTNWEKGRIIAQWRGTLSARELPMLEFSDEAWARLVGGVTGQHAGRLRRVFTRFGDSCAQYAGLYWSHFQAALDWADAEMWLEGAVQNGWSVSAMRRSRWETLGALPEEAPRAEDVVASETDEDFEPARKETPSTITGQYKDIQSDGSQGPNFGDGPDFGDAESGRESSNGNLATRTETQSSADDDELAAVRPFENLPPLPDDVADAFEQFKLVILRHKAEQWSDISRDDLLASLDSLKQLALTPGDQPF